MTRKGTVTNLNWFMYVPVNEVRIAVGGSATLGAARPRVRQQHTGHQISVREAYLNIPMNYAARLGGFRGSHGAKNPAPQNLSRSPSPFTG